VADGRGLPRAFADMDLWRMAAALIFFFFLVLAALPRHLSGKSLLVQAKKRWFAEKKEE
jgi:hypothetical protein